MTGILHVYGEVNVQTISLLRSIASQYSTLKILFSCNEKVILNEITTYMNCVKLADDDKYNLLTAMAPCFNERLFGVVDKHFKIIYPILHDSLQGSIDLIHTRHTYYNSNIPSLYHLDPSLSKRMSKVI